MHVRTGKIARSAGFILGVVLAPALSSQCCAMVAGHWVQPPANGVVVGKSGGLGPLTLCRAEYDNGQHPGKVGKANVILNGVLKTKSLPTTRSCWIRATLG